jgi:23S rRNA (adenine2503-C2)-methyltransferase
MMSDFSKSKKRRMTIAYIMINDINDSERHLEGLIELVKDTGIRINLLPFHEVPGDNCKSSPPERIQFFKHRLVISGISASIRKSKGVDISAACGLLASGLK